MEKKKYTRGKLVKKCIFRISVYNIEDRTDRLRHKNLSHDLEIGHVTLLLKYIYRFVNIRKLRSCFVRYKINYK